MLNNHEIISLYETVEVITDQMLSAARVGDWDQLIDLETRCASHVAILKNEENPEPLTGVVREHKVSIIKKILAHDREIRNLTEPWMAHLAAMMNSAGTERKLSQAYSATQTS